MERTLIVFKPDAVQRGLVGEILARFEKAGLKVVGMKMVAPDAAHFHAHYEGIGKLISRVSQHVFDITLKQMQEGPVVAVALEGIEAAEHVRKMVGTTDPKKSAPGTIRGDYTHLTRDYANATNGTLPNLLHASGDAEEAAQELALWFEQSELYDYATAHQATIHGRSIN